MWQTLNTRFNAVDLKKPLVTKNIKDKPKSACSEFTDDKFNTIFSDNLTDRVNKIYGETLGAIQYVNKFAEEEMKSVFKDIRSNQNQNQNQKQTSPQNTKELVPAFIITMNMIMGCEWPVDMIPKCLESYDGLYIKYLSCCHVIAAFKNENVYAMVSHSGVPYIVNKQFIVPVSIGRTPTTAQSVISNLTALQKEKKEFISTYAQRTFDIFQTCFLLLTSIYKNTYVRSNQKNSATQRQFANRIRYINSNIDTMKRQHTILNQDQSIQSKKSLQTAKMK